LNILRFHIDYDDSSSDDEARDSSKSGAKLGTKPGTKPGAQIGFNYNKKVEKFCIKNAFSEHQINSFVGVKLPETMESHRKIMETAGFINSQENTTNIDSLEIILQTKNRQFTFLSKTDQFHAYYNRVREVLKVSKEDAEKSEKDKSEKEKSEKEKSEASSETSGSESEIPENIDSKPEKTSLDETSLLGKLVAKKRKENEHKNNILSIKKVWSDCDWFLDETVTPPPPDLQQNMNEWAERLVDYFEVEKTVGEQIHEFAIRLAKNDFQVWGTLIGFMCEGNEFLAYFSFRVKKEMEKKIIPEVEIKKPVENIQVKQQFNLRNPHPTMPIIHQKPLQNFNSKTQMKPAKRIKLVDYDEPVSFSIKTIPKQQSLQKETEPKTHIQNVVKNLSQKTQSQKSTEKPAQNQNIIIKPEKTTKPAPVFESKIQTPKLSVQEQRRAKAKAYLEAKKLSKVSS